MPLKKAAFHIAFRAGGAAKKDDKYGGCPARLNPSGAPSSVLEMLRPCGASLTCRKQKRRTPPMAQKTRGRGHGQSRYRAARWRLSLLLEVRKGEICIFRSFSASIPHRLCNRHAVNWACITLRIEHAPRTRCACSL